MKRFLQRAVFAAFLVLLAGVVKAQVFVQQGNKLYATGGLGPAEFGTSVGISADGNVAVIGAPHDNNNIGAVYISRRAGTTWTQEARLVGTPDASPYLPHQGNAVAISADGKTVIVGGYYDNLHGSVWIYRYSAGNWNQQKRILGAPNQQIGTAVSLSADGNTALIGNFYDNSAEVWYYTGTNWNKEAAITCSDAMPSTTGGPYAMVGKSVSLSADGNTALIGGDNDAYGVGAAWVFTRSGGTWTQQGSKITATGLSTSSHFGCAVALSGDGNTALIGSYGENAAYGFTRSGSVWTQQGNKLVANDSGANQTFLGSSLCLSNDGNTALLGGYADNADIGASWIFTRTGSVWTQLGNKLVGAGFTAYASQGNGVSLSADGNTAIAGGPSDDSHYGSAWVFTQVATTATVTIGPVTGTITTCAGTASADPNIQQFTVTASALTNILTATAPAGFEISLDPVLGYTNTFGVPSIPGSPGSASSVIYVRAAASAAPGNISGNVTLSSGGATTQNAAVSGTVKTVPTVNQVGNVSYFPGQTVPAITFTGTAASYSWVIDNPAIGTIPGGTNTIPQFTAINTGNTPIITHITVIPINTNGCNGAAMHFNIAVAPTGVPTPDINAGTPTGTIIACMGVASVSPDIQQFTLSGADLTNNVVLTPTSNFFEISLAPGTGYSNSITLIPAGGAVNTTIYVRSAAVAPGGPLNGTVHIQSGAYSQNVAVAGTIYLPGNVNTVPNKTFVAGVSTGAINFAGTFTAVTWTNDNTAIGLSASGSGNISSFTPVNNTANDIISNITVTPANPTGCNGVPVHFTIRVSAAATTAPVFNISTVTGNITACMGTASASPDIQQFTISGSNLTGNIDLTSPPGFEISIMPANAYSNNVTIIPTAGTVYNTTIYVRSAATATGGPLNGAIRVQSGSYNQNVTVNGTINLPGNINSVPNKTLMAGTLTSAINFAGTATAVTWTNDNTAIGLPASGSGSIPSFTPVNNGTTPLTATIIATPANPTGCNGLPVIFTITVMPASPGIINVSGNLPQLSTVYGTPSTSGTFTVSGDNLKAGITVIPPPGFEVSADNITFSKTISVGSAGTIPPTTVYIRLAKTTSAGTYPGDIILSSTGTPDNKISVDNNNTIAPAPLTITADNKSKITGTPNPALTINYNGFVNDEESSVLTTQPVLSTTAVLESPPGQYPITATGALSANYTITYADGIMTVKPQPISIAISNAFTPNGDGLNDTWAIKNIDGFPNSVVQIYSRYGIPVFYSMSYAVPWDGKLNDVDLPVGTYYYVIDLKNGDTPTTGWVAIIR